MLFPNDSSLFFHTFPVVFAVASRPFIHLAPPSKCKGQGERERERDNDDDDLKLSRWVLTGRAAEVPERCAGPNGAHFGSLSGEVAVLESAKELSC